MFRLTLRSLLAKKLRLMTTAIAIILGVAFTAGTMILADTMTASFSSTIEDIGDGVDTVVRGARLDADDPTAPRAPVEATALETVRAVAGVAAAAPYYDGYVQVIGVDGKAVDLRQSVGLNWIDDPDLTMFRLVDGAAPTTSGEVVLGDGTATEAGVAIGDQVDLMTTAGRETFTVVGLSALDGGASLGETAFAFFHDSDAATRLAEAGTVDAVIARGDGTMTEDDLTAAVAAALPRDEVASGSQYVGEQQDDLGGMIGMFETVLLAFGVIALFVGSFTIANTFTITVAQRTKELALVRAIGAGRRQVLGSVIVEAGVLGTIAAGLGLAAGLGVAKGLTSLFGAVGLEFPARALVVETSTIVTAMLAGVLVTVVAALVPALRASSVPPVDAMRDASIESGRTSRRRVAFGGVLAVGGIILAGSSFTSSSTATVAMGSVMILFAVLALGPVLVRPVTMILAAPMRKLGASGRLAAANATRNPKRSAATAAALTIGVTLVAGASMFASTARATVGGDVESVVVADRVIRPIGLNPGFPSDVADAVDAIDEVSTVPMQVAMVRIGGQTTEVAGLDVEGSGSVLALDVVEGAFGSQQLAIGDRIAEDRGWTIGDSVSITFADQTTTMLTVGAVFDQTTALPPLIAPYGTIAEHGDNLDRLVFVDAPEAALPAVEALLAAAPTIILDTVDGYAASLAGTLDMVLSLVLGFLGLAVVIAVLGIATTIGLSVHERTRELGVLRAVGMSRRQLRRSIRLESIVIALFGTVIGMAMGVGFTWALLSTLADEGFAAPVVPLTTLTAITLGALLAGTMAAALPARRASRMAVLDAVRTA